LLGAGGPPRVFMYGVVVVLVRAKKLRQRLSRRRE